MQRVANITGKNQEAYDTLLSTMHTSHDTLPGTGCPVKEAELSFFGALAVYGSDCPTTQAALSRLEDCERAAGVQHVQKPRLERLKVRLTKAGYYLVIQPHPEIPGLIMADAYRIRRPDGLVFVTGTYGEDHEEALGWLAWQLLGVFLDGRD